MKIILLFAGLMLMPIAALADEKLSVESEAIVALLASCYEPVSQGHDAATVAAAELRELPAAQASVISGEGGRAFIIRPGVTLLSLPASRLECSVLISKMRFERFKNEMEMAFGEDSPFKLTSQKAGEDAVTREYTAQTESGEFYLLVSARKKYEAGSMQAVLTLGKAGLPAK